MCRELVTKKKSDEGLRGNGLIAKCEHLQCTAVTVNAAERKLSYDEGHGHHRLVVREMIM